MKRSQGDVKAHRRAMAGACLSFCLASSSLSSGAATCPRSEVKRLTSAYHDATVFRDRNCNGLRDPDEQTLSTGSDGRVQAGLKKGLLYLEGGFEIGTEAVNPFVLTTLPEARGIGVFSTIWRTLNVQRQSVGQIRKRFGLKQSDSLARYVLGPTPAANPKSLKLFQKEGQLQTLLQIARALLGDAGISALGATAPAGSDSLIWSFTAELLKLPQRPVNLADTAIMESIFSGLGITQSPVNLAAAIAAASALNALMESQPAQLAALARLRAKAADRARVGDFVYLAQCYTVPELANQLQGAPCSYEGSGIPEITRMEVDNGPSADDGITNDTTPTLRGTAPAGIASISVYRNGAEVDSSVAVANGTWSYTTPALPNDTYSFTVTGRTSAGQESLPSAAKQVQVYQSAGPKAPSINQNNSSFISTSLLPGLMPPLVSADPRPFLELNATDGGIPVRVELQRFDWSFDTDQSAFVGPVRTYSVSDQFADRFIRINIIDKLEPAGYFVRFIVSDVAGNESCRESFDKDSADCVAPANYKDGIYLTVQPVP